jgi:YD repeat-containing protein
MRRNFHGLSLLFAILFAGTLYPHGSMAAGVICIEPPPGSEDDPGPGADNTDDPDCSVFYPAPDLPTSEFYGPPSPSNPMISAKEPVNTATGNYYNQSTDLAFPGRGLPFIFTRTYNAQDPYAGPLGPGWTHSYNIVLTVAANGVVAIKQADGHQDSYAPSGGGNFLSQTPGVFSVLVQNSNGSYVLTTKDQVQYKFTSTGVLSNIIDKNGNPLSFSYNPSGTLSQITDTVGRKVSFSYNSSNRITRITDPIGRIVQYSYDSSGNLASRTDPAGGTRSYTYDTSHRIITITDERGIVLVTNTYDTNSRILTQVNGRGFATTFIYGTGQCYFYPLPCPQTTVTDPLGNATTYMYDGWNRLVQITNAANGIKQLTYDINNTITAIVDENGHYALFGPDANGNTNVMTDGIGILVYIQLRYPQQFDRSANTQQFRE